METFTQPSLEQYRDIQPLCEKGHVVLVQNVSDGELYVKKRQRIHDPAICRRLMAEPIANTPRIYALWQENDELILIEEYIPGVTLAERMAEGGLFSEQEAIGIGLQLCRILMDMHECRPAIVHRDIKPSNVMLTPEGTVKLLDFSAAKAESEGENRDTVLLGTAGFAAPEQYGFSSSTPQTDIYGVGVLLNTLVTGALPWETAAGGRLQKVIRRCLQMKPRDRYADAWELHRALKRAKNTSVDWLPPGFRTLKPWKMLIAAPVYFVLTHFCLSLEPAPYERLAQQNIMRLTFFLFGLAPILFYCDYLGMRRLFPLMRSPRRRLRTLGMILAPVFLTVIIFTFCIALQLIYI